MITYEQFCRIKQYREEGLKAGQIAAKIDLDTRTVKKWMKQEAFQLRLPANRPSKLDPYKDAIISMLERHPYTARQLFQQIAEQGFDGGYTIVKVYVRKIRPRRQKAFLKLAFAPGECAQVDWGSYKSVAVGSTRRRLSFFVMVLCHSRMMYVEFTVSQTMEHFLGCHQRALEYFGRVPAKIMVDNLKSAVLRRVTGQEPVFNPRYLDFANHYGFRIVPCAVGKGNEKGIVENAVGYVKKNFLAGLEPGDFKIINPAARHWLETIANVRIHGETRKKPSEMLEEELACLSPLPAMPYDIASVIQVRATKQFRVSLDNNRYSVPAEYAGAGLTMKVYTDRLCIYHDNMLVARHTRSYDRHLDIENPDHPKVLLQQRRKARDQKIMQRFLTLCANAERYYEGLVERKLNMMHHVRQIVGLSEIYGTDQVARVLDDALEFQAFSCEYIANLLEQRKHIRQPPGALHLTRSEDLLELEIEDPDMNIYAERGTMNNKPQKVEEQLEYLKLRFMDAHYQELAATAACKGWSHGKYFEHLIQGEADLRWDNAIQRRIRAARFPVVKTLEQFQWNWPKKINQQQIRHLFRLNFVADKANVIMLSAVGLGKTHLATAIGYNACLRGYSVLFTTAVDVINTLTVAQNAGQLKNGLKKYLKPSLLILDELGYLPIDKRGADLLFQVISGRYEKGAVLITSNRAYKDWPEIFNNDSTLTSAMLDRLLHHADTVIIEGKSYRMKEQVEI